MKDLTLSNVLIQEKLHANVLMPQNMVPIVEKFVPLTKKLKLIKIEMAVNALEPKLELNSPLVNVKIVHLAIIPKDHVTKNVLKKLIPMEQKLLAMLAMLQSKPVTQKMEMLRLVQVYPKKLMPKNAKWLVKPMIKEKL
jgi:hypothetical protein